VDASSAGGSGLLLLLECNDGKDDDVDAVDGDWTTTLAAATTTTSLSSSSSCAPRPLFVVEAPSAVHPRNMVATAFSVFVIAPLTRTWSLSEPYVAVACLDSTSSRRRLETAPRFVLSLVDTHGRSGG
jgi:hypothetical protein